MFRRIHALPALLACVALAAACGDVQKLDPDGGVDGSSDRTDGGADLADAGEADAMPDPVDPAMLTVDRTDSDFGDVLRGGRSQMARFVISNTGEETAGTISISTTGDGAQFDLGDGCSGTSLGAGGSCELEVTFAPQTNGGAAATFQVEASPGGALSIHVTGNALEPGALQLDDVDHDFGAIAVGDDSPAKTFTVENTGDVATGTVSVTLSDPDAFAITSDDCAGISLDAHATCQIAVSFQPDAVGSATGSLTVSGTPGGNAVASLGGTGTASVIVTPSGTGGGRVLSTPAGIDCGAGCDADFDTAAVTLRATANNGSVFAGWSGDCNGTSNCALDLTGDAAVGARFEALRALAVQTSGNGSGSVASSPAGISCPGDCAQDYVHGTQVTLTATAGANSVFGAWTGCPAASGATCTVPMTAAATVTARFDLAQRALNVAVSGRGSVTSSPAGIDCGRDCSQSYDHGTSVTLTATAATGADFSAWTGCDTTSGNTCTVAMTSARNVNATFVDQTRHLTVQNTGSGTGSTTSSPAGVSCPGDCGEDYEYGTSVTLTAVADRSSVFSGWSGCDTVIRNTCTVAMTSARSVSAKYTVQLHALTIDKTGNGSGTVSSAPAGIDCGNTCSHDFTQATIVVLTATADAGSSFSAWSGCDSVSGNECKVEMSAARSVVAKFVLQTHTLTVQHTGTGTGNTTSSPAGINCPNDCSQDYTHGTSVTLTAIADRASIFSGWSGCDSVVRNTCTVAMSAARNVSAKYTGQVHALTLDKTGNGFGTVKSAPAGIDCGNTCSHSFDQGTIVVLTATADAGSSFSAWSGCDSVSGNECKVEMSAARSVIAKFVLVGRTFTLDIFPSGLGGGTVTSSPAGISCGNDCSQAYAEGTQVRITATPNRGSTFAGWSGGGCSGRTACTVTMDANRQVKAVFDPILQ